MSDFYIIDAHVHTAYSQNDCKQPMEGYLELLKEGKANGFGFADHMHPPSEAMSEIYEAMKRLSVQRRRVYPPDTQCEGGGP